jgi:hypothetical protein
MQHKHDHDCPNPEMCEQVGSITEILRKMLYTYTSVPSLRLAATGFLYSIVGEESMGPEISEQLLKDIDSFWNKLLD